MDNEHKCSVVSTLWVALLVVLVDGAVCELSGVEVCSVVLAWGACAGVVG